MQTFSLPPRTVLTGWTSRTVSAHTTPSLLPSSLAFPGGSRRARAQQRQRLTPRALYSFHRFYDRMLARKQRMLFTTALAKTC